jgi:hypothetical protein
MIDTAKSNFPSDMTQALGDAPGTIEAVADDLLNSLRQYVREKPESAALWALGIGFVLGWKLKPW